VARSRLLLAVVVLFAAIILLPSLIVRGCNFYAIPRTVDPTPTGGPYVALRRAATGTIEQIPLEQYIKGVVAAEMPALFDLEALRAQAVLARTYIITRMRAFGGPGDPDHAQADISDDPARGQAWLDEAALRARWGTLAYPGHWRQIEQAVNSTAGLIAVYGQDPIQAAYHSTCGGRTEDSSQVWSSSVPYLVPVTCQWCTHSPRYQQQVSLTWREIETKLGPQAGSLSVAASGGRLPLIRVVSRTPGDRAQEVRIGDLTLSGTAVRAALGLPSAAFTATETAGGAVFTTRGYGHGVGLCQYGADGLAKQGKSFDQIIAHYMPGVTVRQIFSR